MGAWTGSGSRGGSTAGVGRHRLLQANVVTQVALALVLLLGAGLMIRTLSELLAADPGFDAENVITAQVAIPTSAYAESERRLAFFDELLDRAPAIPGVEHAALIWACRSPTRSTAAPSIYPAARAGPGDPERHHEARVVSGDYFRTMRIPLDDLSDDGSTPFRIAMSVMTGALAPRHPAVDDRALRAHVDDGG